MNLAELPGTLLSTPRGGIPELVNKDIQKVITALGAGKGEFAVDTERAMGIRYSGRAYLVQIKRRGGEIFLIDPVGIETELAPLAQIMHAEWILHAADQDLPCLAQLGLSPRRLFDTEIAGLLLGYESVSLQFMTAHVLGYKLAKEHSRADWSKRPLEAELRAYAALDVELLHELKDKLTVELERAGRAAWLEEECEYVRTRPPRPPKKQPWRKAARQNGIKDRRAFRMLELLWQRRDELAKARDLAPDLVIPARDLGALAKRRPRSQADVRSAPQMRSRVRKKDIAVWWDAINEAWKSPLEELPEKLLEKPSLFPPVNRWQHTHRDAYERWNMLRPAVLNYAAQLGIRQEVLLKPQLQKRAAWEGWKDYSDLQEKLLTWGARNWQCQEVVKALSATTQQHSL